MIGTLLKSFEKIQIQGSVVLKDKFDVRWLCTPAVKYSNFLRRKTVSVYYLAIFSMCKIPNCCLGSYLFGVVTHRHISTLVGHKFRKSR